MSGFDNVVVGKLRLKGKALDVKGSVVKKIKKKHKKQFDEVSEITGFNDLLTGLDSFGCINSGGNIVSMGHDDDRNEAKDDGSFSKYDEHLTPAERRYIEQTEKLEVQRLAKIAAKSHRDRIQEFNKYLTNLSEHYDIPKVGPG